MDARTAGLPVGSPSPRFDLLDVPLAGRFLRWRWARTVLQWPLLIVSVLMVYDGLVGPRSASENSATVLTWIQFRGLVVLGLLVAGNLFCMGCPFILLRDGLRRFIRPVRSWPRPFRNKWPAVALLAAFLFAYERFDLWNTPWWTAWLILAYFAGGAIVDGLFRGASFCKYLCPVGQFNFLGSTLSPLEVRVREPGVCETCRSKDCIKGRDEVRGCELWLFQPLKLGNMDCTFCLDCIHACPHDNVGISARVPGSELSPGAFRSGIGRLLRRRDLGALAAIFTFGALLNAFSMIGPVHAVEGWIARILGSSSETLILSVVFTTGLIVEPLLLLTGTAWIARRWSGDSRSLLDGITRYVYALVPVGFGMWTAHYLFHFLTGLSSAWLLARRVSLGLGLAPALPPAWILRPMMPGLPAFPVEAGIIGLGCLGSLLAASEMALADSPRNWYRSFIPWAGLILALTLSAVWLMRQPMEMRGTMWMG